VKIETIQEKIRQGRYIISFTHTEKLRQRRIKAEDIERAIATGVIIEDYREDRRGSSCLILGFAGKRPLHVVCGRLDADEILVITAYEPDVAEWENDWKTRKRE
jgi:hypothetical protein